jgi:hypothetical protein
MTQWRATYTITTDDDATDDDATDVAQDMGDTVPPHWWADLDSLEPMTEE